MENYRAVKWYLTDETALPPAPGLYEKRDKNFTPANAAYVLLILIWFPVQSTPHDKPIALGKPC